MERKGYDEGFDKNKVEQDIKSASENSGKKYEHTMQTKNALRDRLKKLPMNIVEFCIGVGLLILCWSYIQSHPAEKSSLFSGIEAIIENVDVKITERRTGQGVELQRKNKMLEELTTLKNEAESLGECVSDSHITHLERSIKTLESTSIEEFIRKEDIYGRLLNTFYGEIQNSCK